MMLRVIAASATPPRGVMLAPDVALISVAGADCRGGVPVISYRGEPLPAPQGMVTIVPGANQLQIVALRLPGNQHDDLPLLVASGGGEHLPLHLSELDSDPLSIAAGLDGSARWRLLEFLLNFCCAAFRLGRSVSFTQLCIQLALDCTRNAGVATVEAQVVPGRLLVSGMEVPARLDTLRHWTNNGGAQHRAGAGGRPPADRSAGEIR